jgi:hypothetical protein
VRELAAEVGLRLAKAIAAALVGLVLYLLLIGPLAVTPTAELALLAWLSGAALILLMESSPI